MHLVKEQLKKFKKIFEICFTNDTNEFYNDFADTSCIFDEYDE